MSEKHGHLRVVQAHVAERRASRAAVEALRAAAEPLATSSHQQPPEAEPETETEPEQPPTAAQVPEAETGAAMPTEPEAASAALPEDFFEPVAEPVAQPDLTLPAICNTCDFCGTSILMNSIRFAIHHQPINGKRPV